MALKSLHPWNHLATIVLRCANLQANGSALAFSIVTDDALPLGRCCVVDLAPSEL